MIAVWIIWFDELICLDSVEGEFKPNLCSGEFGWVDGKFIPE